MSDEAKAFMPTIRSCFVLNGTLVVKVRRENCVRTITLAIRPGDSVKRAARGFAVLLDDLQRLCPKEEA